MIKNVIFDVDGVIRGYKNVKIKKLLSKENLKKYPQYFDLTIKEVLKKYKKLKVFEDYDLNKVTKAQLLEIVCKNASDPKEIIETAYNYPFTAKNNFVYKKVIKLITRLKKEGYKLYILSNMNKDIVSIIPEFLDTSLFDDIIFSCNVGLAKPYDDIYNFAVKKWGISPEESIFIDDKAVNLEGFSKLGGNVYCFDYKNERKSVKDLLKKIKNA